MEVGNVELDWEDFEDKFCDEREKSISAAARAGGSAQKPNELNSKPQVNCCSIILGLIFLSTSMVSFFNTSLVLTLLVYSQVVSLFDTQRTQNVAIANGKIRKRPKELVDIIVGWLCASTQEIFIVLIIRLCYYPLDMDEDVLNKSLLG